MEELKALPAEPDKAESPAEPKGSKDFTAEERATIIAKAKEVGFEKVADEFGIKARLISYWIQQEKKKAAKGSKRLKRTRTKGKGSKLDAVEYIAENAPTVLTEPTKAIELVIADKPEKPTRRKAEKSEEKRIQTEKQIPSDKQTQTDGLIIENAILKERIALLNREIEKLRTALTSLM